MSDALNERLAAAKLRLVEAEARVVDLDTAQMKRDERLSVLEEAVSGLAAEYGLSLGSGRQAPLALATDETRTDPVAADPAAVYVKSSGEFAAGLRADRAYLIDGGVTAVRWDELLPATEIAAIDAHLRRPVAAEAMNRADLITVGVCAGLGALAVVLDDAIDGFVKDRLCDLHDPKSSLGQSDLGKSIRQWDKDGKNLAIDYSGQGIGGPRGVHRVRSAGHDLLRPFAAIDQIRSGQFQGHRWEDGVRIAVNADRPHPDFAPYRQVGSVNEAILVWLKHLASDFTTSKSLPIPGATFMHNSPHDALRSIGAESYKGGLNLRRVLISGMLPVATVEAGVRLSVHIRAWRETGSARLTPERKAKLQNMLLLTHGIVAAASAGKVAIRWQVEGPAALRHLDLAVLGAVARYATPVMVRYLRRNDPALKFERNERELAGGWDQLLQDDGFMGAVRAFDDQPRLTAVQL